MNRALAASLVVITVCFFIGCQTTSTAETAARGEAFGPAQMPIDPREGRQPLKEARYAAAIEGVGFDTDRVVVLDPLDGSAPDLLAAGLQSLAANRSTAALTAFTQSVRADPTLVEGYVGIGRAQVLKGHTDEAISSFRTAIDLSVENVPARFELAYTLARRGDFDEAAIEMKRVIAMQPDHAEAHERLAIWSYYLDRHDEAVEYAGEAERLGKTPPPQFMKLLGQKSR